MSAKLLSSALCICLIPGLTGCEAMVAAALRSSCDWQMVQSVGGIALGKAERENDGTVVLPIRCNVSGLEQVTVEPTTINSGLVCEPPHARVRGSTICLTIRTTIATSRNSHAASPAARLGKLRAGVYSAVYRDPNGKQHPLGAVQVPE